MFPYQYKNININYHIWKKDKISLVKYKYNTIKSDDTYQNKNFHFYILSTQTVPSTFPCQIITFCKYFLKKNNKLKLH